MTSKSGRTQHHLINEVSGGHIDAATTIESWFVFWCKWNHSPDDSLSIRDSSCQYDGVHSESDWWWQKTKVMMPLHSEWRIWWMDRIVCVKNKKQSTTTVAENLSLYSQSSSGICESLNYRHYLQARSRLATVGKICALSGAGPRSTDIPRYLLPRHGSTENRLYCWLQTKSFRSTSWIFSTRIFQIGPWVPSSSW